LVFQSPPKAVELSHEYSDCPSEDHANCRPKLSAVVVSVARPIALAVAALVTSELNCVTGTEPGGTGFRS
jgi:hypothetical protein